MCQNAHNLTQKATVLPTDSNRTCPAISNSVCLPGGNEKGDPPPEIYEAVSKAVWADATPGKDINA